MKKRIRLAEAAETDAALQERRGEVKEGKLSFLESQIKQLGIESGARMKFIDEEAARMTPDKREAWLAELEAKSLMPHPPRPR